MFDLEAVYFRIVHHMGKRQGPSGGRGREEKCEHESLLWFPWEGMGRAVEAGVGWASSNSLRGSGALGHWAVWYPRLVAWEGQNPIKEVVGGAGSGWICLQGKGTSGWLFLSICKPWEG